MHNRSVDLVSWLSFLLLPRLPGRFVSFQTIRPVADNGGFVPITVAGPLRLYRIPIMRRKNKSVTISL